MGGSSHRSESPFIRTSNIRICGWLGVRGNESVNKTIGESHLLKVASLVLEVFHSVGGYVFNPCVSIDPTSNRYLGL